MCMCACLLKAATHHEGVVHEVEPVGVVLADVVHRQEHRFLALARQLDVALAVEGGQTISRTQPHTQGDQ